MIKSVLSAAALSLLVSSAAWAVPTASPVPHFANSFGVLKVGRGDEDRDHHGWDRGWRGHQSYRDDDREWRGRDDRYRSWHRYSYRPDNWEERGCVSIGPVWYCS
jgi:hypothetical protein